MPWKKEQELEFRSNRLRYLWQRFSVAVKGRSRVRKSPKVKSYPTVAKLPTKIKTGLLPTVLIVILLLIIVGGVVIFNTKLKQLKFTNPAKDIITSPWRVEDNLTLMILGLDDTHEQLQFVDSIQIVYIQPDAKNLTILSIDPDIATVVNAKGASYTYRQLLNYYQAELSVGVQEGLTPLGRFTESMENSLGIHIDRFISIPMSHASELLNLLQPLRVKYEEDSRLVDLEQQRQLIVSAERSTDKKMVVEGEIAKSYVQEVSNPVRFAQIVWSIMSSDINRLNKLISTNLSVEETWPLVRLVNAGGYRIRLINTADADLYINEGKKFLVSSSIDQKISSAYIDNDLLAEQARIDIINGTGEPGLANRTQRALKNLGLNVVRTGNAKTVYYNFQLYAPNADRYAKTIARLQAMFPNLQIIRSDYPDQATGDMTLVVI